jgi:hypothetical protein
VRRIVLFILAAFASLAFAPAARAQFVYEDIAWGSDVRATTEALAAHGFVLNTEFVPDEGELLYEGADDVLAMATFADDQLVGLRFIYTGTADEVEDMYAQSVEDSRQSLGEPASEEDDVVAWESGDTWYSVMLGEVDAGPYVAVQFAGPGYSEEIARRTDGGGTPVAPRELPPLEERWAVVQETPEFRTAVDRSTIVPQGNRIVRAWAREDYATPRVMHISYDQVVYQMDYDCAQRRVRLVTAVYRLNGERMQNDVAEAGEPWTPMEPETSGERVLLTICEAGGRR